MADEIDAGAAYLAALKRSTIPQATGAAPARAPTPASPPGTPLGSTLSGRTDPAPEQRRSPRYPCQGSAQLREIHSGTSTWATFSDISLHGCYVEAATAYASGSVLALTIEVNGFRVEAKGEVRASYPGLGMGISFTEVSEKDRERLRALVRSLSQPSIMMGARTEAVPSSDPQLNPLPAAANPALALEAITKFFEDRHVMGREEFLRIVRKSKV